MMTKILLLAGAIGLTASAAGACGLQKSVQANVDPTVVASVTTGEEANMSVPVVETRKADDAKAAVDTKTE